MHFCPVKQVRNAQQTAWKPQTSTGGKRLSRCLSLFFRGLQPRQINILTVISVLGKRAGNKCRLLQPEVLDLVLYTSPSSRCKIKSSGCNPTFLGPNVWVLLFGSLLSGEHPPHSHPPFLLSSSDMSQRPGQSAKRHLAKTGNEEGHADSPNKGGIKEGERVVFEILL